MARNTLQDLNNHLFEQLERLNDDELSEDDLNRELKRADSMTKLASQIIQNGHLALRAQEFAAEYGIGSDVNQLPARLTAPERKS